MKYNQSSYENVSYSDRCGIKAFVTQIVSTEKHWHEELEIIYIMENSVNLEINEQTVKLNKGEIIVINPNQIHQISKNEQDNIVLIIQVSKAILEKLEVPKNVFENNFISKCTDKKQKEISNMIKDECNQIIYKLHEGKINGGDKLAIFAASMKITTLLYENFSEVIGEIADSKTRNNRKDFINYITKIFEYIEEHYKEQINIEDVSKAVFLSSSYLAHILKIYTGETFHKFLNHYRIECIAEDLVTTEDSIIDIYHKHGFNSNKTFNRVFKDVYGCSPSQYRKNKPKREKDKRNVKQIANYIDVDIDISKENENDKLKNKKKEGSYIKDINSIVKKSIKIDYKEKGTKLDHFWKKLMCAGRASDILRADWREQLKTIQSDIGFSYIRFHGIFNDEMGVVQLKNNEIIYNFDYIDQIFDFLLDNNLRPFVELSFMPKAFATKDVTVFWYEANVSKPKKISMWCDLIKEFMRHIIRRYGKQEIKKWYFEVWNEPDISEFYDAGFEEYIYFYGYTARAIKEIMAESRVGGPAVSGQFWKNNLLKDFLYHCSVEDYPLDFVSVHLYESDYNVVLDGKIVEEIDPPHVIRERINGTYECLNETKYSDLEVHVTEWNSSARKDQLIHDTAYKGPFVLKSISQSMGTVDSLGYWIFSDIMEEDGVSDSAFHGGFGLMNKWGLKKPSYFAYEALNNLGTELLYSNDNCLITRSDEGIQILAWNYCHYEKEYNNLLQELYNRYSVFEESTIYELTINIEGLKDKKCSIINSKMNQEAGSIYDYWVQNEAIEYPSKKELNCLRKMNHMDYSILSKSIGEPLKIKMEIPSHGFELYEINIVDDIK